ncbi:hypothetical protein COCON_G00129010 [Conger conger]|uniref:RBR-type E3 ubiquitin transferase n=1 Tax=Conger conger TaxID=82655 RepID=A0A9Q1HXA0_CONCO|nr:hypothetical protein COCON_G00129010 [Conger conger]
MDTSFTRRCPRYAVIAFGCASCPKITCGREGCGTEFCYHCKQLWHPNQTCDAARQQRAQSLRLRTVRSSSLSFSQESGATADDIKPCPRCAAYIIKMNDGSCNHMTCAVCGCEFCWLCMKEISDLHYLSPSGCTFWGKKPWSRKKKILWQLGTLVGAPVGIALIAGIAIPAMIIGIPVYVGRKIYNRYEGKDISKHKRNLVIAGGVTLSVIVSPVVAAVTVGIGVPIMLAYVYGVVPISLCRSGGCGVSAGNGKGVRIEFDDENDMNAGGGVAATDSPSRSLRQHRGRAGGSLTAEHGIGAMRDNLSDNGQQGPAGCLWAACCYNRLEVQADIQKERCSLSGESGTVSLGTISDNASTRAMAGSILSSYTPLDRDGSSVEVQVDIESKPGKLRHHSGGSVDEGRRGSGKWAKEPSSSSSSSLGKKGKGKLRTRGGGMREWREDMDAQLLERAAAAEEARAASRTRPRSATAPLPEVEHDRLENGPRASPPRHVAEETVSLIRPARPDSPARHARQIPFPPGLHAPFTLGVQTRDLALRLSRSLLLLPLFSFSAFGFIHFVHVEWKQGSGTLRRRAGGEGMAVGIGRFSAEASGQTQGSLRAHWSV